MSQSQDAWVQPKKFAIGADIAQMRQGFEVAPSGGSCHAATRTGLSGGQAGVFGIKGFNDGQAFFETRNPISGIQRLGLGVK